MQFPINRSQLTWIFVLIFCLITSPLTAANMISTERVISDVTAERDKISGLLAREDIQKKMVDYGISPQEATQRVASLTDDEVRQVSGKIDQMRAGGDGIYIGFGGLILIILLVYILTR